MFDITPWGEVLRYLRGLAVIYEISPPSEGRDPTRTVGRVFSALTRKQRAERLGRGEAILRLRELSELDTTLEPWERVCVVAYKAAVAEESAHWPEVELQRDRIKELYIQLEEALLRMMKRRETQEVA